jgi:hypothetical protein
MKSRSSTGVGMKIDLDYNIETMRITDPGEEENTNFSKPTNIYQSIKAQSTFNKPSEAVEEDTGEISKVTADVQSAKLKQLLGKIKQA